MLSTLTSRLVPSSVGPVTTIVLPSDLTLLESIVFKLASILELSSLVAFSRVLRSASNSVTNLDSRTASAFSRAAISVFKSLSILLASAVSAFLRSNASIVTAFAFSAIFVCNAVSAAIRASFSFVMRTCKLSSFDIARETSSSMRLLIAASAASSLPSFSVERAISLANAFAIIVSCAFALAISSFNLVSVESSTSLARLVSIEIWFNNSVSFVVALVISSSILLFKSPSALNALSYSRCISEERISSLFFARFSSSYNRDSIRVSLVVARAISFSMASRFASSAASALSRSVVSAEFKVNSDAFARVSSNSIAH